MDVSATDVPIAGLATGAPGDAPEPAPLSVPVLLDTGGEDGAAGGLLLGAGVVAGAGGAALVLGGCGVGVAGSGCGNGYRPRGYTSVTYTVAPHCAWSVSGEVELVAVTR